MTRWTKRLILSILFQLNYKLFPVLYRCNNGSLFHDNIRSIDARDLSWLLYGELPSSILCSALDREFPLLFALIHEFWEVVDLLVDVFRSSLFWVKRVKKHLSLPCCFFYYSCPIVWLFILLVLIFMDPLCVLPTL